MLILFDICKILGYNKTKLLEFIGRVLAVNELMIIIR